MNFDFTAYFFTLDILQPLTLRIAGQSDVVIPQAIDEPVEWKDPDKAGGKVLEGDTLWIWPKLATPGVPLGLSLAFS